ncbi:TPA: 50S ribosomal protein L3 [Candidatus Bathyarchaeota archaeon]|nr:50S ribosomal protein L3 [Candidatus Bathyarchaeota archaeon]
MVKKHAPKRGSLAFIPRKRAKSIVAKPYFWPSVEGDKVIPLAFVGYKAGMTHALVVQDLPGSPLYGKEVCKSITVIDAPPVVVCGVRAYATDANGDEHALTEAWAKTYPKDLGRALTAPKSYNTDDMLRKIEESLDSVTRIRLIVCTQPRLAAVPKKKPEILEIELGGGTIRDRFEYAKSVLGKTIRISDVFRDGMLVDVLGVTKGKGFQGPVKRWGIRILPRKSRKTKRGVGAIGPWKPGRVMYTVPRPGQMGFHRRTEYNKRILRVGEKGEEVTPKGGFTNYGIVRGDYVILAGSIPGPPKRLIVLRYPARPKAVPDTPPKISYTARP